MSALHIPDLEPDVDTLTAALAHAECGFYVVPTNPAIDIKHPGSVLGKAWQHQSSRDPQQIAAWFAGTNYGLALHCGRSGVVVLDVDRPDLVPDWMWPYLNQAPYQSTRPGDDPRRGHYIFAMPPGRILGNSTGRLGDGWGEIRGANGVIIVAPTPHPEGGEYQWQRTGAVRALDAEIAEKLPAAADAADTVSDEAVKAFLAEHQTATRPDVLNGLKATLAGKIEAGKSRHDSTVPVLAGAMKEARAGFYPAQLAVDVLKPIFVNAAQLPPKARTEAAAKAEFNNMLAWGVAQAVAADLDEVRTRVEEKMPEGATDFEAPEIDGAAPADLDPKLAAGHRKRAHNLATRYAGKLMHVYALGWHHWDGKRWLEDRTGHAERAVMHILDAEMRAALRMPDGPDRKAVIRAIASASSANGIASILTVASKLSEFAYTVDDLDAAPHLLNTPAATINLDTMTAQRHDPGDRITKITRGCYSHSALTESRWATFIAEVLPDPDVRRYLQKLVGAALFGEVVHDVLVILNGEGRNGKSALIEAVVHALDDYGVTTAPDLLMERHNDAHPTELMNLRGARLAVAAETQKGRRLDAEKMKRLTGGDTITARKIARDEVSWRPTHTLLLATNHLPVVDSTSVAVWERLRVIPFTQTFTEGSGRQDTGLRARLRDEPDAVLTWAVDGWKAYVEDGRRLTPIPAAVTAALDKYRADSDPLGSAVAQFVNDCCAVSPANKIATRELFEKGYEIWRREIAEDAPAVEITEFGKALNDAGYTAKRGRGGVRMRQGITLKPQEMWDTDGTGDGW